MEHDTDADRAEFEAWFEDNQLALIRGMDQEELHAFNDMQPAYWFAWKSAWQAARRAPAVPVPQKYVEKLRAELADEVEAADNWRRLALQFDGHRMQAIGHLKAMLTDPQGSEANALAFIKAPPLHGDAVLAQRIAAIAAAPQPPEAAREVCATCDGDGFIYDGKGIKFCPEGCPDPNEAAPVQLPEPAAWRDPKNFLPSQGCTYEKSTAKKWAHIYTEALYTEQQVRELLANHGIKVNQ